MLLLNRCLANEELACLTVVIGKALGPKPGLGFGFRRRRKTAKALDGIFSRTAFFTPAVGFGVGPALRIAHGHVAILLEMRERTARCVDRDVREIRSAEPFDLCIEIREVPALQQRIVAEVDSRRDVLRHERDLLGLGEEVVDHAIEYQSADNANR